jgi:ataxia telangiectasia mutated family protein
VGVLGCYCYVGIITEEEAYTSELFQKAKVGQFICLSFTEI